MSIPRETFLKTASALGVGLAARVLTRDDWHLSPKTVSRAAARRFRAGLRALEAFVRRVLLLLALQLEHELAPADHLNDCVRRQAAEPRRPAAPRFILFAPDRPLPDWDTWADHGPGSEPAGGAETDQTVSPRPLLDRLLYLKTLLDDPQARARRLAFTLARRRPGPLLAPIRTVSPRYGSEVSAFHTSLGPAILSASRARPPPLGPLPRAGPRLTAL